MARRTAGKPKDLDLGGVGGGLESVDPASIGVAHAAPGPGDAPSAPSGPAGPGDAAPGSEPPKRGRGRPKGSGGGRGVTKGGDAALDIAAALIGLHAMAALYFAEPAIALEPGEATALSESVAAVARCYDIGASETIIAWTYLGVTMAGVYGPRVYVIANKPKPRDNLASG